MNYQKAEFIASYGLTSQLPPSSYPEIAFAGRSNVGKSSMINRLFGRKNLARVSSVPGKTATINFYRVDALHFVDLPGYGYAKVSKKEQQRYRDLMNGYFSRARDWLLIILLMDMRHAPSSLDREMTSFLIEMQLPLIVLLTKADKLSRQKQEEQTHAFRSILPHGDELRIIPFSSVTGQGVEELRMVCDHLADGEQE